MESAAAVQVLPDISVASVVGSGMLCPKTSKAKCAGGDSARRPTWPLARVDPRAWWATASTEGGRRKGRCWSWLEPRLHPRQLAPPPTHRQQNACDAKAVSRGNVCQDDVERTVVLPQANTSSAIPGTVLDNNPFHIARAQRQCGDDRELQNVLSSLASEADGWLKGSLPGGWAVANRDHI